MEKQFTHYINGECHQPSNGQWIDSINPATGRVWAQIARGNATDVDLAARAAARASEELTWRGDPSYRSKVLKAIALRLDRNYESLIDVEINDNGKRAAEVKAQMSALSGWYRHFAELTNTDKIVELKTGLEGVTVTRDLIPFGVIGAITAWNSPLMIAAWKIAPALAAGCTIVLKPSELAPLTTLEFGDIATEAGLPAVGMRSAARTTNADA